MKEYEAKRDTFRARLADPSIPADEWVRYMADSRDDLENVALSTRGFKYDPKLFNAGHRGRRLAFAATLRERCAQVAAESGDARAKPVVTRRVSRSTITGTRRFT